MRLQRAVEYRSRGQVTEFDLMAFSCRVVIRCLVVRGKAKLKLVLADEVGSEPMRLTFDLVDSWKTRFGGVEGGMEAWKENAVWKAAVQPRFFASSACLMGELCALYIGAEVIVLMTFLLTFLLTFLWYPMAVH